ncbi:hypothetical protein ACFRCG_07385 [Embleya sp. NPDC056575]|uniref:hypothetical protein n=1 Tax=unclassified Embleya TaxID=2699296 RepID=UPI00367C37C7
MEMVLRESGGGRIGSAPTATVHPERVLRIVITSPDNPTAVRVVTAGQAIAAIRTAFGHRIPRRPHLPGGSPHRATPTVLHALHRRACDPAGPGLRRVPPPTVGWRPFARTGVTVVATWPTSN